MQERLQDGIKWLAGMTDADGNMGIYKQPSKTSYIMYVPRYSIVTTCKVTIDVLQKLFEDLELGHYIYFKKHDSKTRWADQWNIDVRGYKRVKKSLEMILPYLVTKKNEARLILEYIESRLAIGRKPYIKRELEIIQLLKDCKANRNFVISSETLCLAPVENIPQGEDKVQS